MWTQSNSGQRVKKTQRTRGTQTRLRMGVKRKAAAAVLILLLCLGFLWHQGSLGYHWDSCLKGYNNQLNKVQLHHLSNSSEAEGSAGSLVLAQCPGQSFQLSLLLTHLLATPAYESDVLMQPYLSCWDELVKFLNALSSMVGLISNDIEAKTSLIRRLAVSAAEDPEAELNPYLHSVNDTTKSSSEAPWHKSGYHSLRSMILVELDRGVVDFRQQTDSGCRTILRLHRAMLWLKLFLEKLAERPKDDRYRSPSELCREAYRTTLSKHHNWFVQRAAELAFIALPERVFFFKLACVENQAQMTSVLTRVVKAFDVVYNRTQKALEENKMLDLP